MWDRIVGTSFEKVNDAQNHAKIIFKPQFTSICGPSFCVQVIWTLCTRASLCKGHNTMEPCLGSEGNFLSVSREYNVCGIHVHSVDI